MNRNFEDQLLNRLKDGDETALKEVFDIFYTALCVYSVQFTDDESESEDIVQDLFVRIYEHRLYQKINSLRTYLYLSVRNGSIAAARRRFLRKDIEPIEALAYMAEDEPMDETAISERRNRLQESLRHLSPKEYTVLTEIILNNKQYRQVATEMGVSVNTVKTHLRRAMQSLRKEKTLVFLPFF